MFLFLENARFPDENTSTNRCIFHLQVHFWDELNPNNGPDASNSPFGYRISDFHVGSIHDHTFGFKVDLDIVNEANTFKLVHWKAGDVLQALQTQNPDVQAMPSYFLFNQTRYVEWETVEKETRCNVDLINQKLWTVVNEDHKNKYRVSRGYQIVPMATGKQLANQQTQYFYVC